VLLADEIAEVAVTTAYEAIRKCRPQWLHTRASPTFANLDSSPPALYLDGIRLDDFRQLAQLRSEMVERMEYMNPSDATQRFGTNHSGGAILVTTR